MSQTYVGRHRNIVRTRPSALIPTPLRRPALALAVTGVGTATAAATGAMVAVPSTDAMVPQAQVRSIAEDPLPGVVDGQSIVRKAAANRTQGGTAARLLQERQGQVTRASRLSVRPITFAGASAVRRVATQRVSQVATARVKAAAAAQRTVMMGPPRVVGRALTASYGWSDAQFSCLDKLWMKESGWKVNATNASSGAYGIPQSLPARKLSSAGANWRHDAATQIRWGLTYIKSRYGSPCSAWAHSKAVNWY